MRSHVLLAALLCVGCFDNTLHLPDVPESDPLQLAPIDPALCGFEDNDMAGFGHPGETELFPDEGGKVLIVEEGMSFSWLYGEEELDFPVGTRAVLMRSNDAGELDSVAVLQTNPFVPQHPVFVMDHLSEVDARGVSISVQVVVGGVIQREDTVEPDTGGFVPELLPEHDAIDGFDEIDHYSFVAGQFVRELIDVDEWYAAGEEIQLRFRQHTLVESNGFFTLLDNLCDGEPTASE